jgi:hypothetical protein
MIFAISLSVGVYFYMAANITASRIFFARWNVCNLTSSIDVCAVRTMRMARRSRRPLASGSLSSCTQPFLFHYRPAKSTSAELCSRACTRSAPLESLTFNILRLRAYQRCAKTCHASQQESLFIDWLSLRDANIGDAGAAWLISQNAHPNDKSSDVQDSERRRYCTSHGHSIALAITNYTVAYIYIANISGGDYFVCIF